ncbi:hypothetical protein AMECASPLE_008470 [Ameca splendens]|uniref:Uncharacterized protein n=1 Tax=Ameca splendens TaxID=208324 RepID=A0ABV0ZLI0_9TELE
MLSLGELTPGVDIVLLNPLLDYRTPNLLRSPPRLSNNLRPKNPRSLCSYLLLPDQGAHELKSELFK